MLSRFLVQSLRLRCGAALFADLQYQHGAGYAIAVQGYGVARAHVACGFNQLAVNFDAAFANVVRGQAAGFIKARCP